jgi:hypothetical protein
MQEKENVSVVLPSLQFYKRGKKHKLGGGKNA